MNQRRNLMMKKSIFVLITLAFLLAACLPSQKQIDEIVSSVEQTAIAQVTVVVPTADVDQIVQATFQALTAQAVTPVPGELTNTPVTQKIPPTQGGTDNIPTNTPPGGQIGSVAGNLSYPAEAIPSMAIVAYSAGGGSNDYYYVLTLQGQSSYQIDNLPVGMYHVVAYTMGGNGFPSGLPGGYTQYIVCGMQPACSDHGLTDVPVNAGQVTGNINPQDWYAPDGTFPVYPIP
jgi:hypothetical protein